MLFTRIVGLYYCFWVTLPTFCSCCSCSPYCVAKTRLRLCWTLCKLSWAFSRFNISCLNLLSICLSLCTDYYGLRSFTDKINHYFEKQIQKSWKNNFKKWNWKKINWVEYSHICFLGTTSSKQVWLKLQKRSIFSCLLSPSYEAFSVVSRRYSF